MDTKSIREHIEEYGDTDVSIVIKLCDEVERLQRMWHEEHDERVGLETRLNQANTEIAYWQQEARAAREGKVPDAG